MDRTEYQKAYHAKNPDAAAHRKSKERYKMRVAITYAKFYLLRGTAMPAFVPEDIREEAFLKAREELNMQNVTTSEESSEEVPCG